MKKIIVLLAVWVSVLAANAQYIIKGILRDVPSGKMMLNIHGVDTDSADIVAGHFTIESDKHIKGAEYVMLSTKDRKWGTMFWMQNDTITITPTADGYDLSGSKTQDEYLDYVKWMTPVWDEMKAAMALGEKDVNKVKDSNEYINRVLRPKSDSVLWYGPVAIRPVM